MFSPGLGLGLKENINEGLNWASRFAVSVEAFNNSAIAHIGFSRKSHCLDIHLLGLIR